MDINYYTYIDNQIGYTVDSIAAVFFYCFFHFIFVSIFILYARIFLKKLTK